ncbi:MAG: SDR family NAD(P)-dependent oxidoreductase [Acidimicrobiia bacterium]
MTLEDKRALVTGASRGLGPAIALALATRGARVAVNYLESPTVAEDVAAHLPKVSGGHMVVAGDVSSEGGSAAMIDAVVESFGGLDILVNNAGPFGATPLSEVGEEEWDRVIDVNLKGTWLCTRAAIPYMRRAGWGRVINISAVSANVRNRASYGLAKSAVEVLTEELAVEMGPFATVNAVAPGQIQESLAEMESIDDAWAAAVTDRTPRHRLVTRQEVADVVATICSENFQAMTGTTLHLDGGLRLNRF